MPSNMVVRMGGEGDRLVLHVEWSDHNNVKHRDVVEIRIGDWDKPRSLEVAINDRHVYINRAGARTYTDAAGSE